MSWSNVIGQERVKKILRSALDADRLPHAYLFYGGEGVGKDAAAFELAAMLHCEAGGGDACGRCDSCLKIASLQHPDVRFVTSLPLGKGEKSDDDPFAKLTAEEIKTVQEEYREKGKNPYHTVSIPRATVIKINSIREVRREVSMTTYDAKKRIFIISRAEMMGEEAANMLLKTLEEPSGDTMLILTTSRREGLIPTILSRCQNVRFDPLGEKQIEEALVSRAGIEPLKAALLARLSHGSYTRALEMAGEDLLTEREQVLHFIRTAVKGDPVAVSAEVDRLSDLKDREAVGRFLRLMYLWLRDAFVLGYGREVINIDQIEALTNLVKRFPGAKLDRAMSAVERSVSLLERNVYIKVILLHLAVQLQSFIIAGRASAGGSPDAGS